MSFLSKYIGQTAISDYLSELLDRSKDLINQNNEEIDRLSQEYSSLSYTVQHDIRPKVIRHDSSLVQIQDELGTVKDRLVEVDDKLDKASMIESYISKIDYLYSNVVPVITGFDSRINTNETHIDVLGSNQSILSDKIDTLDSFLSNIQNTLREDYGFVIAADLGSDWFKTHLESAGVVFKPDIFAISARIGKIEQSYMSSTEIAEYVQSKLPSDTTLQKLITFANDLPSDVSSYFEWQMEIDTKVNKNGLSINVDDKGTTLGSYIDNIKDETADIAKNMLSQKWNIPEDVIDLHSWMKDRFISDNILRDMSVSDVGGISAYDALISAYNNSVSNATSISSFNDLIPSILTQNSVLQSKFGDQDISMTIPQWIVSLGKLDDTVWSHATHQGLPFTDYLHSSVSISNISNNAITTWVNDNLTDYIDTVYYNQIRPTYTSVPTDSGLTQMAGDMLSQTLKTTKDELIQMSSIADISKHMVDIRSRIDVLTDIQQLTEPSDSLLTQYIKLTTTIDGVVRKFDTYDDYRAFIIQHYRVPFVDGEGHKYKLMLPVTIKYTDVTYHPGDTTTICQDGSDASGKTNCTTVEKMPGHLVTFTSPGYWSATAPDGTTKTWYGLPPHFFFDQTNGVMVLISDWDPHYFYTKGEVDEFLSQNPVIDSDVFDLYRYTTVDPSNLKSLIHISVDPVTYDITEISLSDDGITYVNSLADSIISANMPRPVFQIIPSLQFAPGTSISDVLSTVRNYVTSSVPNTIYDRIRSLTDVERYATIYALPSTIALLENNISSLSSYVAVQVSNLGVQIDQMIDPDELSSALSQFGSNIQNNINDAIGTVKSDISNLKLDVNRNTSDIASMNQTIEGVLKSIQDISTGGIDLTSFWSSLSEFEIPGIRCTLGNLLSGVKSTVLELKTAFVNQKDNVGNIVSFGLNHYFDKIRMDLDSMVSKIGDIDFSLSGIKSWVSDKINGAKAYLNDIVAGLPSSPSEVGSWITNSGPFQSLITLKDSIIDGMRQSWNATLQNMYDASKMGFYDELGNTWYKHVVGLDKSSSWYGLKNGDIDTREWLSNALDIFKKYMSLIGSTLGGIVTSIIVRIRDSIDRVINGVKDLITKAVDYIHDKISGLANAVSNAIEHITNVLSGLTPDGSGFDTGSPIAGISNIISGNEISDLRDIAHEIQVKFGNLGDALAFCGGA